MRRFTPEGDMLNDLFYADSQRFVPNFVVTNWNNYHKKFKTNYYRKAMENQSLLSHVANDYNVQQLECIDYLLKEIPRHMQPSIRYYSLLNKDIAAELEIFLAKMMMTLNKDKKKLMRLPSPQRSMQNYKYLLKQDEFVNRNYN